MSNKVSGRVVARSPVATALLPRFLEHRRRDVVAIRAALEQGDFETIARIGHNMAGTGVSYGFPELGTLGARLDVEARGANVAAVRELAQSLVEFLVWVEAEGAGQESSMRMRAHTDGAAQGRKSGEH
jgi:HPt (histidine-containing phosphotransfer) domain-containing protein